MATHPVFLPGMSHGQRSLAGYNPWSHRELDVTDQLTLSHFLSHKHFIDRIDFRRKQGNHIEEKSYFFVKYFGGRR